MAEGSGWTETGQGAANAPLQVTHAAPKNATSQHIVYGLSLSFSAAPSSPVYCTLIDPDVSPNQVYWQGYVSAAGVTPVDFPRGCTIHQGRQVAVVMGAGGGTAKATATIHGITR